MHFLVRQVDIILPYREGSYVLQADASENNSKWTGNRIKDIADFYSVQPNIYLCSQRKMTA